jgi:hypothetical protein
MANVSGNLGLTRRAAPQPELIGEALVLTINLALFSFVFTWLVAIQSGLLSHAPAIDSDYVTVLNYVGRHARLRRADPHVDAFAYRDQCHRTLLARVRGRRGVWPGDEPPGASGCGQWFWEWQNSRLTRVMRANLLDSEQTLRRHRPRQGTAGWRLVLRYPSG